MINVRVSAMRYGLMAFVFALLVSGSAMAHGKTRCELCGMKWDVSTTRITAEINGEGSHKFESIGCMFQSVGSKEDVTRFKVLDYASATSESPKQLDGKKAHYLYRTSRLKGSMAPFTAAFATKQAALNAQDELGGDYMTFDQVWQKLAVHFKKKGGQ